MPKTSDTDWKAIRIEYSAGIRSLRDIGAEFGVTHTAISKKAGIEDWTRDLKARIKAKAEALVSKALVAKEVTAETKITEQLTVDVEAQVVARIQLSHRNDVQRARKLVMSLMTELEKQTDNKDLLDQLGAAMVSKDGKSVSEAYQKVISLGTRTSTMKGLADALKTMVGLERQAYGLQDNPDQPPPLPPGTSDLIDAARRVAFMLASGAKSKT